MRRAGFAKETNELAMIVRTSVSRGIFVLAYLYVSRYKYTWPRKKYRRKREKLPVYELRRAEENPCRIWVRTGSNITKSSRSRSHCVWTPTFWPGSKSRGEGTRLGSTGRSGR